MNKLLLSFCVLALVGCGGGGGGNGSSSSSNATVTGTVSGTTVVAYDSLDQEVARNTATGSPKTFTLSLPVGSRSYKFYLIENEGTAGERIFPLYAGSTNVFELNTVGTLNLGYVDTASGIAVPANNPATLPGVVAKSASTTVPTNISASAFSTSDIQGSWNYLGLITGDAQAQTTGWYWGAMSAASSGATTFTTPVTDSLGNSGYTPSAMTYSVSNSGIITVPAVPSINWFGVANKNKKLAVSVATMAPGNSNAVSGNNLQFAIKSGASYTSSDLVGTWNVHGIVSGNSPQWLGWLYGVVNIDGSNSASWASISRSDGNSALPAARTLAISAGGIITSAGSTSHGVMSQDKSMIIMTVTDGGGGSTMLVYQKSGATFTSSDLLGTWNTVLLVSADSPEWSGWARGVVNIDSSSAATWTSMTRSDSSAATLGTRTLSISPSGIITCAAFPGIHGAMSQDKSLFVSTYISNNSGYTMAIYQK